jgi:tetratricopeptide (TPR) repeat protein
MPTPNGVVYQTPINIDESSPETALTPHNGAEDIDIVMNNTSSPYPEDDWESDSDSERDQLPLMWNGHTRSDVHALFQQAGELARHRDPSRAESLFQDAVKGYQRLVGPMHEETSKVVFTLATFYFEQDHLAKAYSLLEKNGRIYLKNLGIHHRRTQQHVADIVQLLHGWGKEDDALAFLARASEPTLQTRPMYDTNRQQKPRNASDASRPKGASQDSTLAEAIKSINDNPQDPDQLNYGLSVIRTHGFVGGEGVRELLMITIKACGQDVDRLAVQRLKTWGELLRFHQRTSHDNIDVQMFKNAHIAFCDVLNRFPWNERKNKFKSFEVIEAALELVAPFVKATYLNDAKRMFQMCEDNSRARFGDEDERTIWMFISIGLVYQRYTTWTEAGPWFERALNAAMEKYNEDDGIRIALEEAMELKHFSYVNDEGRPFRTIFGVGGLKITPMRLHME